MEFIIFTLIAVYIVGFIMSFGITFYTSYKTIFYHLGLTLMGISLILNFSFLKIPLIQTSNVCVAFFEYTLSVVTFMAQGLFLNSTFIETINIENDFIFYFFSFSPFALFLSFSVTLYTGYFREFKARLKNLRHLFLNPKHEQFYIFIRGKDEEVEDFQSFLKSKKSVTFLIDRQYALTDPGKDFTSRLSLSGFNYNNQFNSFSVDKGLVFLENHTRQFFKWFFTIKYTFIVKEKNYKVLENILFELNKASQKHAFDVHVISDVKQIVQSISLENGQIYQTNLALLKAYYHLHLYPLHEVYDYESDKNLNITFVGKSEQSEELMKLVYSAYMPYSEDPKKTTASFYQHLKKDSKTPPYLLQEITNKYITKTKDGEGYYQQFATPTINNSMEEEFVHVGHNIIFIDQEYQNQESKNQETNYQDEKNQESKNVNDNIEVIEKIRTQVKKLEGKNTKTIIFVKFNSLIHYISLYNLNSYFRFYNDKDKNGIRTDLNKKFTDKLLAASNQEELIKEAYKNSKENNLSITIIPYGFGGQMNHAYFDFYSRLNIVGYRAKLLYDLKDFNMYNLFLNFKTNYTQNNQIMQGQDRNLKILFRDFVTTHAPIDWEKFYSKTLEDRKDIGLKFLSQISKYEFNKKYKSLNEFITKEGESFFSQHPDMEDLTFKTWQKQKDSDKKSNIEIYFSIQKILGYVLYLTKKQEVSQIDGTNIIEYANEIALFEHHRWFFSKLTENSLPLSSKEVKVINLPDKFKLQFKDHETKKLHACLANHNGLFELGNFFIKQSEAIFNASEDTNEVLKKEHETKKEKLIAEVIQLIWANDLRYIVYYDIFPKI
jgi:hypothetical protein